jgi:hypothetical protein
MKNSGYGRKPDSGIKVPHMAIIRVIYEDEPDFPPTVHHPDAVRYQVGEYWIDAVGGEPPVGQIDSDLGNLGRIVYQRRKEERVRLAQQIIEKIRKP